MPSPFRFSSRAFGLAFFHGAALWGVAAWAADYDAKSTVPKTQSAADAAALTSSKKPGLQTVIIVYKTHFDIGYTTMARPVPTPSRKTSSFTAAAASRPGSANSTTSAT